MLIVLGLGDVDGKLLFKEMLDTAWSKGSGSVEYRWLNRVDRKVERKADNFLVGVGYYTR